MVASIIVIIFYAFVDIYFPLIVLQITAFLAIAAVLVILAWIGYTLMTTPAPKPVVEEPTSAAPASTVSAEPTKSASTVSAEPTKSASTVSAEPTKSASTVSAEPTSAAPANQPLESTAAATKPRASRKQKTQQQNESQA